MDEKEILEDLSWLSFISKIIIIKDNDGSITQDDMERFEESVNNIQSKYKFEWKRYGDYSNIKERR